MLQLHYTALNENKMYFGLDQILLTMSPKRRLVANREKSHCRFFGDGDATCNS